MIKFATIHLDIIIFKDDDFSIWLRFN